MSLILNPQVIGEPDWEQLSVGEHTSTLTQWYNLRTKQWTPIGWFSEEGHIYLCRMENNYRRPVTFKAKIQAIWMARAKLFRRYILRQTYTEQLKKS